MNNGSINPAWVAAARNGDENALTQLYCCSYQSVYNTIKSMLSSRNGVSSDLALDLLQETYIKAFTRLDRLDRPERFPFWVKAIARNQVLDYLRQNRPLLFSELHSPDSNTLPEELWEDDNVWHLPEQATARRETARLLRTILDSLPQRQRMILGMYYYQDMKIKEIAAALGLQESTVKSQLSNGRKRIRAQLDQLEQEGDIQVFGMSSMAILVALLLRRELCRSLPQSRRQPPAGCLAA